MILPRRSDGATCSLLNTDEVPGAPGSESHAGFLLGPRDFPAILAPPQDRAFDSSNRPQPQLVAAGREPGDLTADAADPAELIP